jgi:hypothetical protein
MLRSMAGKALSVLMMIMGQVSDFVHIMEIIT